MNKSPLKYLENKSPEGSRTCVILFHGYGASMHDLFDISNYMDPNKTCDWFFPDGWLPVDGGGRAWFPVDAEALQNAMLSGLPRDLRNKQPAEFDQAVALGKAFIEERVSDYDRVIVGGFSQGAMICSHIGLQLSEQIDGLWLFSGNLIASQALDDSLKGMQLKGAKPFSFIQSHGRQDPVLGFQYAQDLYNRLTTAGLDGEFVAFNGVHEISTEVLKKAKRFLITT